MEKPTVEFYPAITRRCRECHCAATRAWSGRNKPKMAGYARQWRRRHAMRHKEQYTRWREANRERLLLAKVEYESRRRARTAIALPASGILGRIAIFGGLCWLCGAPWEQIDHVKPLSKGGAHLLANLRPICQKCNRRKSNLWPVVNY